MITVTKTEFSAAADGSVLIAQTATAGTTIHTFSTTTTDYEEVWLWAANNHTANVALTIEWISATAAKNIEMTIPFNDGLYLVIPGIAAQGVAGSKTVAAFAGTTNVITVFGYVNKISGA